MKDALKNISWPSALVVTAGFATLVILTVLEADTTSFLFLLAGLLGGAGAAELRTIKEQGNGRETRLWGEIAAMRKELTSLAKRSPPPPEG